MWQNKLFLQNFGLWLLLHIHKSGILKVILLCHMYIKINNSWWRRRIEFLCFSTISFSYCHKLLYFCKFSVTLMNLSYNLCKWTLGMPWILMLLKLYSHRAGRILKRSSRVYHLPSIHQMQDKYSSTSLRVTI